MLTQVQINNIENIAKDVLIEAFSLDINKIFPPIELQKILDAYSIGVKTGTFDEQNISGMYEVASNTIFLEETDAPARKRFTIAHEVGHIVMHQTDEKFRIFYRSQALHLFEEQKKEEQEANWFAAALLMPTPTINKLWAIYRNVDRVARAFGVANSAAYFRLRNLGLIE